MVLAAVRRRRLGAGWLWSDFTWVLIRLPHVSRSKRRASFLRDLYRAVHRQPSDRPVDQEAVVSS